MEVLERNHVAIDTWHVLEPDKTTFFLTHLHGDHAHFPRDFTHRVYASHVVAHLADHVCLRPTLVPGCWYEADVTHIAFQVLPVQHAPESIGLYFPSLQVVYMGDGIASSLPPERPLTVVYDDTLVRYRRTAPTPRESCALIRATLQRCPTLQVVHHAILYALFQCSHDAAKPLRFRIDPGLPALVQRTARYLRMEDERSEFLLVGRKSAVAPRIVPSLAWFALDEARDPFVVHADGDRLRIFCCLHALPRDLRRLEQTYNWAYFEPLGVTPLHRDA